MHAESRERPWDGVSGAIELRSRLEQTELALEERARKNGGPGGGEWESIAGSDAKAVVPVGAPRGVVHFLGGALLGAFPSASYDVTCRLLSEYANVVVIATPYELSLDHGTLAEEAQRNFQEAWATLRAKYGLPPDLPVHRIGHSLGAKLQLLSLCGGMAAENATVGEVVLLGSGDDAEFAAPTDFGSSASKEDVLRSPPCASLTLMAYNNFSAVDTISLIEEVAAELGGKPGLDAGIRFALGAVPMVARMAERAAATVGVEFSPGPEETLRMASTSFSAPAKGTLILSFPEDKLDQRDDLLEAINGGVTSPGPAKAETLPVVARGHLAPVCVTVDVGDAAANAAAAAGADEATQRRARERGADAMPGGAKKLSLGDEAAAKAVAMRVAENLLL